MKRFLSTWRNAVAGDTDRALASSSWQPPSQPTRALRWVWALLFIWEDQGAHAAGWRRNRDPVANWKKSASSKPIDPLQNGELIDWGVDVRALEQDGSAGQGRELLHDQASTFSCVMPLASSSRRSHGLDSVPQVGRGGDQQGHQVVAALPWRPSDWFGGSAALPVRADPGSSPRHIEQPAKRHSRRTPRRSCRCPRPPPRAARADPGRHEAHAVGLLLALDQAGEGMQVTSRPPWCEGSP